MLKVNGRELQIMKTAGSFFFSFFLFLLSLFSEMQRARLFVPAGTGPASSPGPCMAQGPHTPRTWSPPQGGHMVTGRKLIFPTRWAECDSPSWLTPDKQSPNPLPFHSLFSRVHGPAEQCRPHMGSTHNRLPIGESHSWVNLADTHITFHSCPGLVSLFLLHLTRGTKPICQKDPG